MKVMLLGKKSFEIEELVIKTGFKIVTDSPDVILTYGGDGTLLTSEREFPGIPKLALRDNSICKKCVGHQDHKILSELKNGDLKLQELQKLETSIHGQILLALNDFVVRNPQPMHAIRFFVFKNSENLSEKLIIGDGLVASTPFGSTGYFQSITRSTFNKDFAVAFNNTVDPISPVTFTDQDIINLKIIRGPANLSFDNNSDVFEIPGGEEINIKASEKLARIYLPETLRCTNCTITRTN